MASAGTAHAEDFAARFVKLEPPQEPPLFSFTDANGNMLNLKDFAGHYVVLNLWATWCGPCVQEIPSLDALQERLAAQNVTIIALAEDVNGRDTVEGFFKRHNIQHLTVYTDGPGAAPSILHVNGIPVTFVIDPSGREVGYIDGGVNWATPDSIGFLKKLMSR